MHLKIPWTLSVKSRLALVLTLLFTAAIAFVTAAQLREIRTSMAEVLSAQQVTLLTRVADEVDEKFRARAAALGSVAAHLGLAMAQGPAQAQAALELRESLPTMFDSVLMISMQGQIVVSVPLRPELAHVNVAQRAYFKDTVSSEKGVISAPYLTLSEGKPVVMMTAPIFGQDGRMIGILGGSLSLLKSNFLGNIGTTRVGRSGYFYVVTRGAHPLLVSHPDQKKVMTPAAPASKNSSSALAQGGFEGSMEGTNSTGLRALMGFKQLKETEWIVAAVLPTDEAFGSIAATQEHMVVLATLIAALISVVTWSFVYWLLVPLAAVLEYVRAKKMNGAIVERIPVRRWDEIGELTHEFNNLMAAEEVAKQALAANEERLLTITDNVPVLIGYVDRDQRYQFNNRTYEEWFGVAQKAFLGKTMLEVLGHEEYSAIRNDIGEALQGYITSRERELKLRGHGRYVRATFIPDYGPESQVRGCYILAYDVTEQKSIEKKLAFLAQHDTLTELPNRAAFNERLVLAIARTRRTGKVFAVMYLDIDKFKLVNDTHGHGIGDQLLSAFATRLTDSVRSTDVVARLGGDEFVILVEDLAVASLAAVIAAKIIEAMRTPFIFEELQIVASTSIGVAVSTSEPTDQSGPELLQEADAALYQAKQGGRNSYRIAGAETLA
ncbi:MAG: diguanylate cyclase [Betaproteobacteria bacterium]|nr:diguanylate cyclase [Betaproteobacteria bacterium]